MTGISIARFFLVAAYSTIPFLGGNHLPLFYVTIDKFWIENLFLFCLILTLLMVFLSNKDISIFAWKKFLLFLAPFAVITVLSVLYTWNMLSTLEEINILLWAIGLVFLVGVLPDKDTILKALVFGAFLSSLCAIVQLTILYPSLTETLRNSKYSLLIETHPIPFSSFLYHNIYGGYLALIAPISLYFAVHERKKFYSISTVALLAALLFTTSRIAIGLVTLSILTSLVLLMVDRDVKRILHIVGIVCAGLLIAILLMNINKKEMSGGVQREIKSKVTNIGTQIKTLNTRTEIWKGGRRAFMHKPILGYGAGTFELPYRKYYDGSFGTKYAHSVIIKTIVELGIVGIICWFFYLAGCFLLLRNVFLERRNAHIVLAILSLFLFSIIDFSFDAPAHIVTFFLLTSALIKDEAVDKKTTAIFGKEKKPKLTARGLIIIILMCLIVSFYFSLKVNLSNKALENGIAMEENGFPPLATYAVYRDVIEKMPLNDEGHVRLLSMLVARFDAENDAIKKEETRESLTKYLNSMETTRSRNSELFYVMGVGYAVLGSDNKAVHYFNKALFYCPSSSYYVLRIAEYYFHRGNYNMAIKTIRSFAPYMDNYEVARNPNGQYIYQMRDLEIEIMLREGNRPGALSLAIENLKDAERERFIITNARARKIVEKEKILNTLQKRIDSIKITQFEKK